MSFQSFSGSPEAREQMLSDMLSLNLPDAEGFRSDPPQYTPFTLVFPTFLTALRADRLPLRKGYIFSSSKISLLRLCPSDFGVTSYQGPRQSLWRRRAWLIFPRFGAARAARPSLAAIYCFHHKFLLAWKTKVKAVYMETVWPNQPGNLKILHHSGKLY